MFCKKCGTEIQSGAKFCHNCGISVEAQCANPATSNFHQSVSEIVQPVSVDSIVNKKKEKKFKAPSFVGLIFMIFALFVLFRNPSPKEPDYSEWIYDAEGVGRVIGYMSSEVGFAVCKITTTNRISYGYSSQEAQGEFIIVEIAVHNDQKDAITVDNGHFKLVDDNGREFSYSLEGAAALMLRDGYSAVGSMDKVNPGNTILIKIPFDVPTDVSGLKLKVKVGDGLISDEITVPAEVVPSLM